VLAAVNHHLPEVTEPTDTARDAAPEGCAALLPLVYVPNCMFMPQPPPASVCFEIAGNLSFCRWYAYMTSITATVSKLRQMAAAAPPLILFFPALLFSSPSVSGAFAAPVSSFVARVVFESMTKFPEVMILEGLVLVRFNLTRLPAIVVSLLA
jgi:hypothetical protein